jgi:hypothetical protein
MKRTEIKYVNTVDGQVEITGMKNVASKEEIEEEFGAEVRRLYFEGKPNYFRCGVEHKRVNDGEYSLSYYPGLRLTRKGFGKLIKSMKAAGNRLQRIREGVAKYEEKTVFI